VGAVDARPHVVVDVRVVLPGGLLHLLEVVHELQEEGRLGEPNRVSMDL